MKKFVFITFIAIVFGSSLFIWGCSKVSKRNVSRYEALPISRSYDKAVNESARDIPIAYDVDVVVVGGTTGGVAAAVEAAQKGATVFLAAQRPYLGEDICGTYRLLTASGTVLLPKAFSTMAT
jgi:hypothetical protein